MNAALAMNPPRATTDRHAAGLDRDAALPAAAESDGPSECRRRDGTIDWAALYRGRRRQLATLALLHTSSADDAEELLQETLCRLIERRIQADDPIAYLAQALRNGAITRRRRDASAEGALIRCAELLRMQQPTDVSTAGAESSADPDGDERSARTLAAIDRLAPERREVLLLRIRADLSFAQIATALDMPLNTAASHYRRALTDLRTTLAENEEHDHA